MPPRRHRGLPPTGELRSITPSGVAGGRRPEKVCVQPASSSHRGLKMHPRTRAPPGLRAWRAQPSSGGLGQARRAAFLPRRLSCPRGSVSLTGGPSTPGCWEGATLGSHSAPAHCSLTSGRKRTYVHTNRHTRMHTQTHTHRCTRRAHRGMCMHTHAQRGMCAIIDTHTCAHIHGCTNTHVCAATPMCMCAHRGTHMHAHAAEAGTEAERTAERRPRFRTEKGPGGHRHLSFTAAHHGGPGVD